MARKPNYQFERQERQRMKDAKKAARAEAKRLKAEQGGSDEPGVDIGDDEQASPPEE